MDNMTLEEARSLNSKIMAEVPSLHSKVSVEYQWRDRQGVERLYYVVFVEYGRDERFNMSFMSQVTSESHWESFKQMILMASKDILASKEGQNAQ